MLDSSNPESSLGLANTNSEYKGLSQTEIKEAYSQIPNLSVEGTNLQVTAWSVVKHAHHGPAFGLTPSKYGLTQGDLTSISNKGLINHIRDGGNLPNDSSVYNRQTAFISIY